MNTMNTAVPAGWYPDPQGQGRRFWNGQHWTADVMPLAPSSPAPAVSSSPSPAAPSLVAPGLVAPGLVAPAVGSRSLAGLGAGSLGGVGRNAGPLQFSLAGAAIVFISGFMPWATGRIGGQSTGTAKGWTSSAPWLIGGPSTDDYLRGTATGGTSDFLFILALAIAGAACVFFALNKPSPSTHRLLQAGAGLGAVAALVSIIEVVHMNSVLSDLGVAYGAKGSASPGFGFFLGLVGCSLVAVGAAKAALARAAK